MYFHGVTNSVFIMLTKEQLTDAHEQGLSISTKNGNIKIVTILGDVYGVNHCDTNSKLVKWWMFENFERNQAKIEQPKPKYNGRAVKCDNLYQIRYLCKGTQHDYYFNSSKDNIYYLLECDYLFNEKYCVRNNYEIISFSDYCKENGITEPKWIQGFEIKDGYNDVVMVSQDSIEWKIDRLYSINTDDIFLFKCDNNNWKFCRYPRKNEINEIKFSN